MMMENASNFLEQLWLLSMEAAPFLLLGFGIATLLHAFLPTDSLLRLLGKGRFRPTLAAAVVGVPLPLCSCSVVPTAIAVREKGASPGATLSFFISAPETGVDSILLTYGMMGPLGPVLAVARPLAAGLSALTAGFFLDFATTPKIQQGGEGKTEESLRGSNTSGATCCGSDDQKVPTCCGGQDSNNEKKSPKSQEILAKIRSSFFMLFDEIALLVALGLVFSAALAAWLPEDLGLLNSIGNPLLEMGLAMAVGLPMYVCATASTPLAAVLIAKGLSPGAALVFLLVGPATNIGTLLLVKKFLGKTAVFSYLVSIVVISVLFGLGVNAFCQDVSLDFSEVSHSHEAWNGAEIAAFLLWGLLIWRMTVRFAWRGRQKT